MTSIPNVHPHGFMEWSSKCAACPVERPEGKIVVELDPEEVSRMEKEASDALEVKVTLTAEPGSQPPPVVSDQT
jgi:DNA primase